MYISIGTAYVQVRIEVLFTFSVNVIARDHMLALYSWAAWLTDIIISYGDSIANHIMTP